MSYLWTNTEINNIKECHKKGLFYIDNTHLWPNRTFKAVYRKSIQLGLGQDSRRPLKYKSIDMMLVEMEKGFCGTAYEIAVKVGISAATARRALAKEMKKYNQGPHHHGSARIHISRWTRTKTREAWSAVYAYEESFNVPKPKALGKEGKKARQRRLRIARKEADNPFFSLIAQICETT